ncbi:Soluble aldose sugar dehydrogenase YliI precursor [Rubripirellula obstinata]|uniref:Soluble aldose sugar dehydrogenase YliI n=2 Tax=Rubripirellula obstinata TaxID=406547 RepID=A0A5B1CNW8_9BACT|nr:Soluble aldose sugar dehydrogenase YliI precursor [Rubripirellula obstinata]
MLAADAGAAVSHADTASIAMDAAATNATKDVSTQHLVIIDAGIEDASELMKSVPADAEILLVNGNENGVDQITAAIASHQGLKSIHLLSHGTEGQLNIGNQKLSSENLEAYRGQIQSWQNSVADGGDLVIYGCDVASGNKGASFIAKFAEMAKLDIAASTDRTGQSTSLHTADWDLEYRTGQIETAYLLTSDRLQNFAGQLAIEIFAAGSTGNELMELEVNGQIVDTWFVLGTDAENDQFYPYVVDIDGVDVDDIRINFVNDLYDPANGIDRNLRVDRIVVDGTTFQTEAPSVFGTGIWDGQAISSGNLRSEYLNSNGYFQFSDNGGTPGGANGSLIEVSLRGQSGGESAQLIVDGSVLQTFNDLSTNTNIFSVQADGDVTADRVRIAFTNDQYTPGGFDRNLEVDFIRIDGQTFETEAPTTFSTGTWLQADGVQPGFRQSEVLHTNGYFQYLASTNPGGGGDAGSFSLVTSQITTVEGQGAITLEVQRVGGSDGAASIDFLTASGTAIEGQDFEQNSGRLFFGDGETSKQFTVNILDDGNSESTENFTVRIDNPIGADLLAPRTSIVTVLDDDSGLPRFASFDSSDGLTLNGSASIRGNQLELTSTATRQAGTAFFNSPIPLSGNTSFQSSFTFQMGGGRGSAGADGMTFLLHNSSQGLNALGRPGGFLAYDNILQSVAIEFDNYNNGGDIAANTVAVVINGDTRNAFSEVVSPFDLNNNTLYHAWVEYNGDTNSLAVFVSATEEKPLFAVLKTEIDLDAIVGNQAYVGFSAGNFDMTNYHRVGSWNFSLDRPTSDPEVNPSGDIVEQDLITGLDQPLAVDFSQDGRNLYIAEKAGVIKVARDGSSNANVVLDISDKVNNVQDRGLIDFALDPNFQSNGYIYLLYTYDPPEVFDNVGNANAGPDGRGNRAGRLSRYTLDASTGFTTVVGGSEEILLGKNSTWDNFNAFVDSTVDLNEPQAGRANGQYIDDFIASDSRSHTVGSLAFASDGNLFVSIGDGASFNQVDTRALRVQSFFSLSGKVLRIDPSTGQGVSDNPFYDGDPNSNRSKIYQLGLRNPWRLTLDQQTDRLFIGETGLGSFEEINTGGAGTNFGWPYYEGGQGFNSPTPGYSNLPQAQNFYQNGSAKPATIALAHQGGSDAIVLGDIVYNSDLGLKYEGDLFYNDLYRGVIRHANVGPNGQLTGVEVFTTGAQFVTDIQQGADGSLYYANLVEGTVGRWQIV